MPSSAGSAASPSSSGGGGGHAATTGEPRGYTHLFKIVLIGNGASGKTEILNAFAGDGYSGGLSRATMGIDFKVSAPNTVVQTVQGMRWSLRVF